MGISCLFTLLTSQPDMKAVDKYRDVYAKLQDKVCHRPLCCVVNHASAPCGYTLQEAEYKTQRDLKNSVTELFAEVKARRCEHGHVYCDAIYVSYNTVISTHSY